MTAPFRGRTVVLLVAVGALSLVSALVLAAFGGEMGDLASSDADSYSRSALGHHAFVAVMRRLGVPVVVSRYRSGHRAKDAALFVLEPDPDRIDARGAGVEPLEEMLSRAGRRFLACPKRTGSASPLLRGRLETTELLPPSDVERVLARAGIRATLVRVAATSGWEGDIEGAPVLPDAQLLLRSSDVEPILSCDQGILVGAYEGGLVLSDPDLLANHHFGRGENARIALTIVDLARDGNRTVVVDETLHGHVASPGVWRELFRFPLAVVLLHAAFTLAVALWAGMGRFGAPIPPPVRLEPGKGLLLSNTAQLLRLGGHSAHAVARYWRTTLQAALHDVHAPPGLSAERRIEFLTEVGTARGATDTPRALEQETRRIVAGDRRSGPRAVALACRIHRWREEITHGRRGDPGS